MTKVITRLSVMIIAMLVGVASYGQVEIDGTSYSRLSLAFNAINAGTHEGDIVVKITSNVSETTTAILMASGQGSADYSSVTIYPTGTYTISGNLSNGLVQLQGADYVTIDGRVNMSGSTRALTFKNQATSGPVIRVDSLVTVSDAANYNKIQYCNIEHSTMSNGYGITYGASNSFTGTGSSRGNEINYCQFRFMYMGIRLNGASGREVFDTKIIGNYMGNTNLMQTVSYQPVYCWYVRNTVIEDNVFENLTHTSAIFVMYLYYANDIKVNNNIIRNVNCPSSLYGIYAYFTPNAEITGNRIENFRAASSINYPIYVYHNSQTNYNVSNNYLDGLSGTSTFYGIYLANGGGGSTVCNNNVIKNVENTSTTYGIFLSSCANSKTNNNLIENINSPGTAQSYPYYLSSCATSEFIGNTARNITAGGLINGLYATSCNGTKFNNNIMDNFQSNSLSTTTAAVGLRILSSSSSSQIGEIVNNSISRMYTARKSSADNNNNPYGIHISSGTHYRIYYNSVNLTGTQLQVGTSATRSACLMITTTSINNLDIRNHYCPTKNQN